MEIITPYNPCDATAGTLMKGDAFTFVEKGGRVRYMMRVFGGDDKSTLAIDLENGRIWDIDPLLRVKRCPRAILITDPPRPEGSPEDSKNPKPERRKAAFENIKTGRIFKLEKPETDDFSKMAYMAAETGNGRRKAVSLDDGSCLSLVGNARVVEYPAPRFYPFGTDV